MKVGKRCLQLRIFLTIYSTTSTTTHPVPWLMTLSAVPLGQGSNPVEGRNVCKCIVPLSHGGTLNSRRPTNPIVRLVERKEKLGAPGHSPLLKLG
ncbi:hypothetical protein TNCV_4090661 [Trichonephila clavipes]|uniref:Uncharacterized protein n=1 Tax=Trichonephila clavipes TaxID=2585209 RepID=A0A8X6VBY4_TRICX|nr:hypothetical protein TNCV_4090661 [Trichonephila clavipes]